jgi:predicted MFS family arabinose efflux permease
MLPARLPIGAKKESPLDAMKGGIAFVRDREGMLPLIVLAFLMTLLGLPLITFLPVMARDVLHLGADAYSTLLSISGLGSVTGALIVASMSNIKNKGRAALLILTLLGGITIAFSASKVFWVSCVILFLGGAALISVFTLVASLVQLQTTDDMRGRVMSVYNVAFRGGMPFGNLTSGRLMELHGAPFILAINGTLLIALSIYFLVVQRKIARI